MYDTQKKFIRSCAIFCLFTSIFSQSSAARNVDKTDLIHPFFNMCQKRFINSPVNMRMLSRAGTSLDSFCSCFANYSAASIHVEDIAKILKSGTLPEYYNSNASKIAHACANDSSYD